MQIVLKSLLYFVCGLISFGLLFYLADTILSRIPGYTMVNAENERLVYEVFVLSNGVHTDLVFPIKSDLIDWRTIFPLKHTLGNDSTTNYVAIGWGDKGFYLNTPEWKDLKLKTALIAGFGIGETALHVTYYRNINENEYCYRTTMSGDQYQKLIAYIRKSLELDTDSKPILIETNAQYGNNDAFYEANGAYSLFYSCNTWTNQALKAANLPSGVWTIFDKGILRHYKK